MWSVVQIRLLGGVRASDDSGVAVDVGPAKCQAVLAALALQPGSVVSVSRIVEMVWGEEPPRTAEKTLQSYVTRLRKGLGADSIVHEGAAYRLTVDPAAVDVARFQRGSIQATSKRRSPNGRGDRWPASTPSGSARQSMDWSSSGSARSKRVSPITWTSIPLVPSRR